MLENQCEWVSNLYIYCNQETKNYFYNNFIESNDPQNGNALVYPIKSYEDSIIRQKLKKYSLPNEFYQFKSVSNYSMAILQSAN
jgi:hypothetical protein